MTHSRTTWPIGMALLASLVITLLVAACNGGAATPAGEPTEEIVTQTGSRVRRELDVVWAGPGDVNILPRLGDGWHNFATGSRITTDEDGEGLVEIEGCLDIYVFQHSGLVKATCPESDYAANNVMCMEEGGAGFNNQCSGQLIIQTRSADVLLEGTWVSIFYLPDTRLTLVLVFDHTPELDTVRVRPVLDFESRTLGDYDVVREGFFWFSAPEGGPDEVANLAAREPHPFDLLPALIDQLDLWPWLDRVQRRADRDDVPFPDFEEVVDDVAPTIGRVAISPTDPAPGDSVTITAQAKDPEAGELDRQLGIDRIEIYVEGRLLGRCAGARCSATVEDVSPGVFSYRVEAYDLAGNRATAEDTFSIAARGLPDLVITAFEAVGPATFPDDQNLEVPVQVTVRNQGGATADRFSIAINYVSSADSFQARFIAPGQEDTWAPLTGRPLPPGESVTLEGVVQFRSDLTGSNVSLFAVADSCAGEEFMPQYCRVEESNESNNVRGPLADSSAPARGGSIVLTGAGGPLKDVRVQEAMLAAAPWAELAATLRQDGTAQEFTLAFPDAKASADEVEYSPDLAYELLAESGYPDGFGLLLLFPADDAVLQEVAPWIRDQLAEFGLDVAESRAPAFDLDALLETTVAGGEAALLLQR